MDSQIRSISRQFELRLAELDLLQGKLNKQLAKKYPGQVDPFTLLERLRKVSNALPELCKETTEVNARKANVLARLEQATKSNSAALEGLKTRCALEDEHVKGEEEGFDKENYGENEGSVEENLFPGFGGFVGEAAFENLSTTIRGRATYSDTKKLYTTLYQHFEEDPQARPLSIQDLAGKGAKVAGLKGQNSINTLRHLKLISVSKAGITLRNLPKGKRSNKKGSRKRTSRKKSSSKM